jgi:hypothetical protein
LTCHFAAENGGVIHNFAKLLAWADAPYLMFCDGDDVWLPHKVSKTLAKMKELEALHAPGLPLLVHTDLIVVDAELKVIAPSFWKFSKLNTHVSSQLLPRMLVQNQVTGCTMLINRRLKELASPVPLECVMHDWWLALVAACLGRVAMLPLATLYYRQHGSNDTGAKPYGLLAYCKRKSGSAAAQGKTRQAEILLSRYAAVMPAQNRTLLQAYLSLRSAGPFKKVLLMLRHGFFKSGLLRNFILNH